MQRSTEHHKWETHGKTSKIKTYSLKVQMVAALNVFICF